MSNPATKSDLDAFVRRLTWHMGLMIAIWTAIVSLLIIASRG